MFDFGLRCPSTGQTDVDIRKVVVSGEILDRHMAKKRLPELSCFYCDEQKDEDENQFIP
jgi:hypothetical protein